MSTWTTVEVACPGCGGAVEARLARGVHATRAPQTRDAVLAGTLHRPRCTRCAAVLNVEAPFLYTDFGRGHWVHVGVATELGRWRAIEREALAGFDRWLGATSPIMTGEGARFTTRVVFGIDELRERLIVWDAGLDDMDVECAKLIAVRARPSLRGHAHRLRVELVDDEALHVAAIDAAQQVRARWTTPRRVVAAIDRAAWQRAVPELFERGFVSIDRLLADEAP